MHEQNFEQREKEKTPFRGIEVYMVRHGKQNKYEDSGSALSPEGERQAREFAHYLVKEAGDINAMVKIKFSKEARAVETAELIKEELEKLISEDKLENIKLLADHPTKQLKTTGALKPVIEAGIPYEEVMEEWLKNTDNYPSTRTPNEIKKEIDYLVDITARTAERLSSNGPSVIYVWVTHETAHAAVLQALMNKTPNEMGGSIGHLEPLKISFNPNNAKHPVVNFRNQSIEYESLEEQK